LFIQGGLGVDVFFAISGFILGLPFAKHYLVGGKKVNLKSYFIRRLTRLEPPYLISLIVLFALYVMFFNESIFNLIDNFVASIFYIHFFTFGKLNPINPVTWSLETEVQFYILAPLISSILFIKNHRNRRVLLIAVLLILDFVVPYTLGYLRDYHMHKSIINYLHSFLVGYAFVDVFTFGLDKIRKSYLWDIVGAISLVLLFNFHPDTVKWERIYFDIGVFGLFMAVFKGYVFNYIFTREFIVVVGGMCYTIYLLHYPVIFVIMKIMSTLPMGSFALSITVNFTLSILGLLAVSAVFFKLIERPCMDKNWPIQLREFFKKRFNKLNGKN
jgi:peptidoglycan/LPS O-acetylase OafA/YrhL